MSNDNGTPEETSIGQLLEDVVLAVQASRTIAGSKEFAMFNLRHSLPASTKFRSRERERQFGGELTMSRAEPGTLVETKIPLFGSEDCSAWLVRQRMAMLASNVKLAK